MRCWRVELPERQTGTHNEFQVAECGLKAVKHNNQQGVLTVFTPDVAQVIKYIRQNWAEWCCLFVSALIVTLATTNGVLGC